ncbi:MAG: PAS domain S-box protein [Sphingomonadales bacterium]
MTKRSRGFHRQIRTLTQIAVSDDLEQVGLDAALQKITEATAEALDASRVSLWSILAEDKVLRCIDLYDREAGAHGGLADVPLSTLSAYRGRLQHDSVVAFDDVEQEADLAGVMQSHFLPRGIRSSLSAAIHFNDGIHGVLNIAQTGEGRRWSGEEKIFAGSVAAVIAHTLEHQKRLQAETRLREREAYFRALIENAMDIIAVIDTDGTLNFASPSLEHVLGYGRDDLVSVNCLDLVHPEDRPVISSLLARGARRDVSFDSIEARFRHRDQSWRTMAANGRYLDGDGNVSGFILNARDITEQKKVAEQTRYQAEIIENINNAVITSDLESGGLLRDWNRGAERLWGHTRDEIVGKHNSVLFADDFDHLPMEEIRATIKEKGHFEREGRLKKKDGEEFHGAMSMTLLRGASGVSDRIVVFVRDITESKKSREAILQAEQQFRTIVSSVQDGLYIAQGKHLIYVNQACADIVGTRIDQLISTGWVDKVHPDDRERVEQIRRRRMEGLEAPESYECRLVRPDGEVRHVILAARAAHDYPGGPATIGTIRDVTEFLKLQQQLEHAHRMESLGQLTGGIAHDFNNLLTIIMGNAELACVMMDDPAKLEKALRQVVRAAERGAELTHRLLAFARRQQLRPVQVNLNELIEGVAEMLERTLGAAISLKKALPVDLWPTLVDPGQLENVILNLCLNGRDAMPEGGVLTIETGNVRLDDEYAAALADVTPGEYVVVSVADTGVGMTSEVLEHAFEPFFTTKEVGKGTGLGLAMVYGFAKQSTGHATIYSEVGHGTTVKIYLPRLAGENDPVAVPMGPGNLRARGEVVLVVEDDPDVRTLAVTLLNDLGYEVLAANGVSAAIDELKYARRINMLLTDVVLPGDMRGPDVAREAARHHPGIKVLFMSGYTEKAAHQQAGLDDDAPLLNKPFKALDLARRMREVLDAAR